MIAGFGWPDILIAVILVIAAFKGFSRGFVSELGGAVAVVAALITPWYYNGAFDPWLENTIHLGPGSAHVVGIHRTTTQSAIRHGKTAQLFMDGSCGGLAERKTRIGHTSSMAIRINGSSGNSHRPVVR